MNRRNGQFERVFDRKRKNVCVCVCVCVGGGGCKCVCVYVCVRERVFWVCMCAFEGGREECRKKRRDGGRGRE